MEKELKSEYAKAYTEVWEILQHVVEEDIAKIPKDLMEVFEEYQDPDYDYYFDSDKPLKEADMLIETKAILLNLYRDYWASPEEREAILKLQELDMKACKLKRYNQMLDDDEE